MAITGEMLAKQAETAYQERWGYIWCTAGEIWTQAKQTMLEKKYNSDQEKYKDYEMAVRYGDRWFGRKVTDCSGLIKWATGKLGLKGIYHGSNSMFNKNCKKVEKIRKGVKIPIGAVIFTGNEQEQHNHVGILISSTCVLEARGTQYGVVHTALSNKKWTYWGMLNGVSYEEPAVPVSTEKETTSTASTTKKNTKKGMDVSYPTLRRGAKGDLVYQMQALLQKDGSNLEVDGIFGIGTLSAVKSFQKRHGLVDDGIVGPKTWAELLKLV